MITASLQLHVRTQTEKDCFLNPGIWLIVPLQASQVYHPPFSQTPILDTPFGSTHKSGLPPTLQAKRISHIVIYGFLCSWLLRELILLPSGLDWQLLKKDFLMPLGNIHWLGLLFTLPQPEQFKHNKWTITFYLHSNPLFFLLGYEFPQKSQSSCTFYYHIYSVSTNINWQPTVCLLCLQLLFNCISR